MTPWLLRHLSRRASGSARWDSEQGIEDTRWMVYRFCLLLEPFDVVEAESGSPTPRSRAKTAPERGPSIAARRNQK